MARLGMTSSRSLAASVRHPDRTTNKAGGEAFDIRDPSLRLLTMVGGSFWNEPQYYGDTPGAARLPGLSDEATLVVSTAVEIARGPNPRDLLALALWARSEMNIRTTPQVLLAVAANEPATKAFVRAYTPRVVQRADELRQVFAAYLSLFAGGVGAGHQGQKLPNSLKKGLADAFAALLARAADQVRLARAPDVSRRPAHDRPRQATAASRSRSTSTWPPARSPTRAGDARRRRAQAPRAEDRPRRRGAGADSRDALPVGGGALAVRQLARSVGRRAALDGLHGRAPQPAQPRGERRRPRARAARLSDP